MTDLDAIRRRWSTYGGMGNPRSADDYTDAGCRVLAEHAFRDVNELLPIIAGLEAQRDHCIERLNAVHALVEHARKISPSETGSPVRRGRGAGVGDGRADTAQARRERHAGTTRDGGVDAT